MPTPPTLRRIVTLQNLGVFHNFASSAELPDLRRYNLIYGFNGSGKTTLARVFGSLGAGALRLELPEGGTFEVELTDGTVIKSAGGTGLIYSSYFSGTQRDSINFAAFTPNAIYVSGSAGSADFPGFAWVFPPGA